ncbi:MAG: hypothetical protein EBX20_07580 [Rhodobacterales bacterium]|nr:hypothetical protein [Rhodobacterales bacterium]
MSAEIAKSSLSEDVVISMSCAASELPKYNCTLILKRKEQDLGPIGYLRCDAKRPLITAFAHLTNKSFEEWNEAFEKFCKKKRNIYGKKVNRMGLLKTTNDNKIKFGAAEKSITKLDFNHEK